MKMRPTPTIVSLTLILSAIAIFLLQFPTQPTLNHHHQQQQQQEHQQEQQLPVPVPVPAESDSSSSSGPKPESGAPNNSESDNILHHFFFFDVSKDGSIHFLYPEPPLIPPSDHFNSGVKVKDVQISPHVSARIFLPHLPSSSSSHKLPLLLYVHGGGFCAQSAFNVIYSGFVGELAARAQVIAVSIEYGLFPARPIPACYDDSWEALQWLAAHSNGSGPESWLNQHADLKRLFLAGDSAGANICYSLANRTATVGLPGGLTVEGMIMIHPYFGDNDPLWMFMCPDNEGPSDRRMKPAKEDVARLTCRRMVVIVAEMDPLRNAGVKYVEEVKKSGWKGKVELVENMGKQHCFFLGEYRDPEALANIRRIVNFIHYPYS